MARSQKFRAVRSFPALRCHTKMPRLTGAASQLLRMGQNALRKSCWYDRGLYIVRRAAPVRGVDRLEADRAGLHQDFLGLELVVGPTLVGRVVGVAVAAVAAVRVRVLAHARPFSVM